MTEITPLPVTSAARAVAYRMLGSAAEAEDAVQEAWLRFHRTGAGEIENVGAWLTTVGWRWSWRSRSTATASRASR